MSEVGVAELFVVVVAMAQAQQLVHVHQLQDRPLRMVIVMI